MKILLLTIDEQKACLDPLYRSIVREFETDHLSISREMAKNLGAVFSNLDMDSYDRSVIFLRFRDLKDQVRLLKGVRNLVLIEHDACQNYIKRSPHYKQFSKLYRRLPGVRVITSGATVSTRLQKEGFDAIFVPKGYDNTVISNLRNERDIELGFIGSTKSSSYHERAKFLSKLSKVEPLTTIQTNPGLEYNKHLNRILYFASCDAGIGEYMIKNFEAMAAGCVLFAFNQGESENQALGFRHEENIMLYDSIESFQNSLRILRKSPELRAQIAENGQELAARNFCLENIGRETAEKIALPLSEK